MAGCALPEKPRGYCSRLTRSTTGRAVQFDHSRIASARGRIVCGDHGNAAWKTKSQCPHEYTLRREAPNEKLFEDFVMHIRHHGYRARFNKSIHTYLDLDDWQYWTMGSPLARTILINRAELSLHQTQR